MSIRALTMTMLAPLLAVLVLLSSPTRGDDALGRLVSLIQVIANPSSFDEHPIREAIGLFSEFAAPDRHRDPDRPCSLIALAVGAVVQIDHKQMAACMKRTLRHYRLGEPPAVVVCLSGR